MKFSPNILFASLGALVVFGNFAYSYRESKAMEARLQKLESRVEIAEARVVRNNAAFQVAAPFVPPAPARVLTAAKSHAALLAYSLAPSSKPRPNAPTLDERVRRLELELAPHASMLVQTASGE